MAQDKVRLPFPPLYLMQYGFEGKTEELLALEEEIGSAVYDARETNIFVARLGRDKPLRAVMELKTLKVFTEPAEAVGAEVEGPASKRRKLDGQVGGEKDFVLIDDSETASEDGEDGDVVIVKSAKAKLKGSSIQASSKTGTRLQDEADESQIVKVVNVMWASDSLKAGKVLSMDDYLVYAGKRVEKAATRLKSPSPTIISKKPIEDAFTRARDDSPPPGFVSRGHQRTSRGGGSHSSNSKRPAPSLRSDSTAEFDAAEGIPLLPDHCKKEYCCQRPTPSPTPNDPFIGQLKKILLARKLLSDDIGERAYNKAIATIAAYPYTITTVAEIQRLPGCGPKYAALYREWKDTGRIVEVEEFEQSEKMQILKLFYGIHDVGGKTANLFYGKGWRDLDDIVTQGWDSIDRNQQVGLKWYDEFQVKIPREEVQRIGAVVLEYANNFHLGFQMVICGGYRRGKRMCGDVDIILTHVDEEVTDYLIDPLVIALADDGWIQHQLSSSNKNSERGQEPLNWRGGMPRSRSGFDSLDKALVVWQDPNFPDMDKPEAKNPNIHRRVDIIISPWKTAGCAIVGWTGGTMFERDIRRYCREQLKYKFDSTGVRTLGSGAWVDLEGDEKDLFVKEKKVFEGLGLEYFDPTLRCTDG